MVGNDVVDLKDPETQPETLHPRFDDRVMSHDERGRLENAKDPQALRWTMWAAKESAYKLVKRHDHSAVFAHSLFETDLDEHGVGGVRFGDWSCAVRVSCEDGAVHCIAAPDTVDGVITGVDSITSGNDPSTSVRRMAIDAVAEDLGVEPSALDITNDEDRVPHLSVSGHRLGHLSLSHHGDFVAFAWRRPC